MGETAVGEISAFQAYREAGIQYLDLLHDRASIPAQLIEARNRFMAMRNDWHRRTASIDGRVAMMQLLMRAA